MDFNLFVLIIMDVEVGERAILSEARGTYFYCSKIH